MGANAAEVVGQEAQEALEQAKGAVKRGLSLKQSKVNDDAGNCPCVIHGRVSRALSKIGVPMITVSSITDSKSA